MVAALGVLLSGYLAIGLSFACFFGAAWHANHGCFAGGALPAHPSVGDFLYFSLVTLTTLGYGEVYPNCGLTKALCCTEVMLGFGWTTVVLASTTALLQPRLAEIAGAVGRAAERREVLVISFDYSSHTSPTPLCS